MTLLVAYASVYGSTQEMAQTLTTILRGAGYATQLCTIDEVASPEAYEAVILGSPIHCGMWTRSMHQFVYNARASLQTRPLYVWITCLRVLEKDGYAHAQRHYVMPEIREMGSVRSIEVFGGRIVPASLSWEDYTDLHQRYDGSHTVVYYAGDYREWPRFRIWAQFIVDDLKTLNIMPTPGA